VTLVPIEAEAQVIVVDWLPARAQDILPVLGT
jgi:hypothetical protein